MVTGKTHLNMLNRSECGKYLKLEATAVGQVVNSNDLTDVGQCSYIGCL